MNSENLNSLSHTPAKDELQGVRKLLSHLHGEVASLETSYAEILGVLKRLEGQVALDDLTGLLRRNAFFARWNELIAECERLGETCGLMILDIDHFKKINDTFGHPTGDDVIKRVADLLRDFEAPSAIAGRLGGEEFVVGIRGNESEIIMQAQRIRRAAERMEGKPIACSLFSSNEVSMNQVAAKNGSEKEKKWKCTVSIGVAIHGQSGSDSTKLLDAADQALYLAKKSGRNQVRVA